MKINAMLLKDFYKMVHLTMCPSNMTKSVSYFTPRKSRIDMWPKVVNFGLQAFIKEWLIENFNETFFNRSEADVVNEYKRICENTMVKENYGLDRIVELHRLGYLPIEIWALPEGAKVPMHVPIFGITNTHPDFAWLGQALESLISAELWYPMITATVGYTYRKIVDKWYDKTVDDNVPHRRGLGNFDFRGDMGVDASLKAAGGWMLSFVNTATVPAIPWMEKMYNCNCETEEVGFGAVSTEHFVMCSNSALDTVMYPDDVYPYKDIDPHRERVFIKKLLTELYPNTSFSCVSDSYDYWNVVENILPTLKDEILNHNGCMLVRGDSGDCVEVVTKTVFKLWDIFGGTVNSKGYKVLNPHIKALYGDSITIERADKIFKILEENGFAANNVSLGVGSFSMHCIEEDGQLKPFTRDTFSSAIKAVYAEFTDEQGHIIPMNVYKDPKTDRDTGAGFKKSQKGCCIVYKDENGEYAYTDEHDWFTASHNALQELRPIFKDGKLLVNESLKDIRNRLHDNEF
ncbi:MAG: nicotinate phosphoribosyltransferase [Clostridia bacterium]|nr:nicotinate phosphoribosyltransferase [Clostridia bacterium]